VPVALLAIAIADKAERAEKERQAELDKRALEAQLTQNDSDLVTTFPFSFNNQQETLSPTQNDSALTGSDSISYLNNQQETLPVISNQEPSIEEQWNQPEEIKAVASLLADCESIEMLAELRECAIPTVVFKTAARSLKAGKRQQIKDWVLTLNG